MAYYYIDAVNGNDTTGNGSNLTPWKTINKVWELTTHNIIFCKPGMYTIVSPGVATSAGLPHYHVNFVGLGTVIFKYDGYPFWATSYGYETTSRFSNIIFGDQFFLTYYPNYSKALVFNNCEFIGQPIYTNHSSLPVNCTFNKCISDGKSFNIPHETTDQSSYVGKPIAGLWQGNSAVVSSCSTSGIQNKPGFLEPTSATTLEPLIGGLLTPDQYQTNSIDSSFYTPASESLSDSIFSPVSLTGTYQWKCATQGWIKDPTTSGTLDITDDVGITLVTGDGVAALSPVMKFSYGFNFSGISLTATESEVGGVGQKLDSTPATVTRTIEFRHANTAFTQTQTSGAPSWQTYDRKTFASGVTCTYLQLRVVFQMNATI
jgi:hypothetical protein